MSKEAMVGPHLHSHLVSRYHSLATMTWQRDQHDIKVMDSSYVHVWIYLATQEATSELEICL